MKPDQQKLAVWEAEAGMVCHEFEVFCNYLLEGKAGISKSTGMIGKKDCFELNQMLSVKAEFERPTHFQKDYPVINYFYFAAVCRRILEPDLSKGCMRQGRYYQYYREAPVLEQYLLLVMGALFDGRFVSDDFAYQMGIEGLMRWAEEKGPDVNLVYSIPAKVFRGFYWGRGNCFAEYLEEFGALKVHERVTDVRKPMTPWKVEIRPLFELVYDLYRTVNEEFDPENEELNQFCFGRYWETHISGGTPSGYKQLLEQPCADYGNQVADLEIKVRNGKCLRVVRVNLSDSLYRLHLMIQKVFEFDNDHLFAFYIGQGMLRETVTIPEAFTSGEEYSVHDTMIGDLEPRVGDKFSYLFDFGDEWWFDIKVKAVAEGSVLAPELIKAVHEPPRQYPEWDDEDEYDMEDWPV